MKISTRAIRPSPVELEDEHLRGDHGLAVDLHGFGELGVRKRVVRIRDSVELHHIALELRHQVGDEGEIFFATRVAVPIRPDADNVVGNAFVDHVPVLRRDGAKVALDDVGHRLITSRPRERLRWMRAVLDLDSPAR